MCCKWKLVTHTYTCTSGGGAPFGVPSSGAPFAFSSAPQQQAGGGFAFSSGPAAFGATGGPGEGGGDTKARRQVKAKRRPR